MKLHISLFLTNLHFSRSKFKRNGLDKVDYMKYVFGYIRQLMTDSDLKQFRCFYAENAVSHTKKAIVGATKAHGIVDMAL